MTLEWLFGVFRVQLGLEEISERNIQKLPYFITYQKYKLCLLEERRVSTQKGLEKRPTKTEGIPDRNKLIIEGKTGSQKRGRVCYISFQQELESHGAGLGQGS